MHNSIFLSPQVSAFHWDHNDTFSQFSGCHALLPDGYMSILSQLSRDVEVHLNTPVTGVGVREDGKVCVVDARGKEWGSDKVGEWTCTNTRSTCPFLAILETIT